jgi:threonine aldolase
VPYHSGKTITAYTSLFDSVYVSLWKCFNAASGAVLAGSKEFTEGLFHLRRMFGGGLPQAWPFASVAMRYSDDYAQEYSRAWAVADEFLSIIRKDARFTIEKVANGTSAFLMGVEGITAVRFAERLLKQGIVLSPPQKAANSFWMTVNPTLTRMEAGELAEKFLQASRP